MPLLSWSACTGSAARPRLTIATAVSRGRSWTCLEAAGVRYAVLGQEESCTGDPARRMGNDYVYQLLAAANVDVLNRYRPKTIITACPHCFNTIGNEYGQLGGKYDVVHHSQFLSGLIAQGRLRVDERRAQSVTLHDSCYLTRYNGVISETREVLGAVPGVEPHRDGEIGQADVLLRAGGGRMWMEEKRGTRINAERTRQALETERPPSPRRARSAW